MVREPRMLLPDSLTLLNTKPTRVSLHPPRYPCMLIINVIYARYGC